MRYIEECGGNSRRICRWLGNGQQQQGCYNAYRAEGNDWIFEAAISNVGGRNRKVAEAFARSGGKRSFDELEAELLGGQKLQGVLTAGEVFQVLKARNWEEKFPLFATVHKIASDHLPPSAIVEYGQKARKPSSRVPVYQ